MSGILDKIGKVVKGAKIIAPDNIDKILDVAEQGIETAEKVKDILPKKKGVSGKADAKLGVENESD